MNEHIQSIEDMQKLLERCVILYACVCVYAPNTHTSTRTRIPMPQAQSTSQANSTVTTTTQPQPTASLPSGRTPSTSQATNQIDKQTPVAHA